MALEAVGGAERSAEPARAGRRRQRWLLVAVVLLVVVIVDQATKEAALRLFVEPWPILPGVGLALSFNTGAAFSMGTSLTPFITAFAGVVVVAIAWFAGRAATAGWALVLGLVGGGAAGNLIDRLARPPGPGRGAVVDFVDVAWFAAFNLADAALTIGVAVAFVLSWRGQPVLIRSGGAAR
ncbi:signal peptidase II [Pseudonocardia broussonetiae]|uniref:Lipoprotein signal peptidase n=1 Tax=Pseudonocardia broussonetiae TaxID=2736640 RepID=A0A6M6JKI9_9PSEU|nr:signal peptidase II [Pseudonocardia broussonetiae]QJY47866.1 signal peptidase II [Pseudonocardia broussonetiae]